MKLHVLDGSSDDQARAFVSGVAAMGRACMHGCASASQRKGHTGTGTVSGWTGW